MFRSFAILAAMVLTAATFTVSGTANAAEPVRFTLERSGSANKLQLSFRSGSYGNNSHWSNSISPAELQGLNLAALGASGSSPIAFALVREAGRIDCRGSGGNSQAIGHCSFAPNPAFGSFLASRGIARPTERQSFTLALARADSNLVNALQSAGYPTPSVDQLASMAVMGVTPGFIGELARRGYRLRSADDLVKFRVHDVTPEFIDGFARAGYRQLDAETLVKFRIFNVTPRLVEEMARLGYRDLDPEMLVKMRIFDVTPEFVAELQRQGVRVGSVEQFVRLKMAGYDPKPRR
jgi:hypothetical protein